MIWKRMIWKPRPWLGVLLLGIAATLVQQNLVDEAWLAEHTVGFDQLRTELAAVDVTEMARRCGIAVSTCRFSSTTSRGSSRRDPSSASIRKPCKC